VPATHHCPTNVEMDSSWMAVRHQYAKLSLRRANTHQKEAEVNATTVAVDLAKNVLEHYSPSRLPPAAAKLKMNALDATTVTEHDIAASRARELNGRPGRCICPRS
jgi:hypothetical protein